MSSLLEKLKVLVALLSNDKVKHFVFCIAIASFFVQFGWVTTYLVVGLFAGLKEGIDKLGAGTPDFKDFLAGIAGVAALHGWYTLVLKYDLPLAFHVLTQGYLQ